MISDFFNIRINENNCNKNLNNFNSFQHLIIYGCDEYYKNFVVKNLLENIYGKKNIITREVEYIIAGYNNVKTKVYIKQSKNHIIIEPTSNGFDKYLIHEIIEEYTKHNSINILHNNKVYKTIIINKIDNISHQIQSYLRRIMEKYSSTCKFILLSSQLFNIISHIRSRAIQIRIPLFTDVDILTIILKINILENRNIKYKNVKIILNNSDNKINKVLWLIDLFKYKSFKSYDILNYNNVINDITCIIYNSNKITTVNELYNNIKTIREKFYLLFITNIVIHDIIKKITNNLLNLIDDIEIKYKIIESGSIYETRINKGARQIIQFDAYIISLIKLLYQ